MVHRTIFDGRSAYEVALEGDVDHLWDAVASPGGTNVIDIETAARAVC
jgi:hypothetical protein